MLTYAVIVFGLAALGGLVLASSVLRGRLAPWPASLLHAALGAVGLVLLFLAVQDGAGNRVFYSRIILAIAALGGFYLASVHLKKEVAPGGLVMVHAGAAVIGFLLLVGAAFSLF